MQNIVELKKNRRAGKRFTMLFQTRFLVANSSNYKDCIIIDISRTGACAKLPAGEKVMIGDEICFELPAVMKRALSSHIYILRHPVQLSKVVRGLLRR